MSVSEKETRDTYSRVKISVLYGNLWGFWKCTKIISNNNYTVAFKSIE